MSYSFYSRKNTNWALCCFCQTEKSENVKNPYEKKCYHAAYDSIESDLKNCINKEIQLPYGLNLECLLTDDEQNLSKSLLKNKATYHKNCRDKIRPEKVSRIVMKRAKYIENELESSSSPISPKKTRTSFEVTCNREKKQCFYCYLYEEDKDEHICKTENVSNKMKEMAKTAQNWVVYSRLNAAFDNTASDIFYHKSCYVKLFNEARAAESKVKNLKAKMQPYDPLVIAEIVAYIQYTDNVMKLADLKKLYIRKLEELNSEWLSVTIHTTRFKEHILNKLGDDWEDFSSGRDIILSTKMKCGQVLMDSMERFVSEEEAKKIVEVGLLLRKHVLSSQFYFNGSFAGNCLSEPVPNSLFTLLRVLLQGASNLQDMENHECLSARNRVACSLSQLIISNTVKRGSKNVRNLYQTQNQETPLPLYIGLKLHAQDRLKSCIRDFHPLGVVSSYDRIMSVRKKLAKAVSKRFKDEGVVVPTNCKRGVFTTGTTDNIDVSGRTEMHGTAITLINHISRENSGIDPLPITLDVPDETPIELAEEFSIVPYIEEKSGDIRFETNNEYFEWPNTIGNPFSDHEIWLNHVKHIYHQKKIEDDWALHEVPVTFSGFFSKKQKNENVKPKAVIGVFPVFSDEKADTLSMQKHAMLVVKKAIEFLNPGQIPVIAGDCPLYARQKKCQLFFPDEIGEEKMVCMMGFLHVEMCCQEAGGKLMGGSGWERMFVLADIFKPGVASSLLGGKHVKRTRTPYLLTLAWLDILRENAYTEYCKLNVIHDSFEAWEQKLFSSSPTAFYWGKIVRDFLLTICYFIHSQRFGNWLDTLRSIDDMCPYFFALGHTSYARWLPVFLRDMYRLPRLHPEIYANFMIGNFVVQRSNKKFSLMGLDQSQEQSIKFLKEDSGPKGLYGRRDEKMVIELSKCEVLRLIDEYESSNFTNEDSGNTEHSESSISEQKKYLNQLERLLDLVDKKAIINPYDETEDQLVTLDTGECMDPEIINSLRQLPKVGKDLYMKYVEERINNCTVPISDVISKPNQYTFLKMPPVNLKKGADKISSSNNSIAIITQMFISLQARPDSDMKDFFRYENSRYPPSLSCKGKFRVGTKSLILDCLPGMPSKGKNNAVEKATVVILDMAAVIHIINPRRANIFGEYIEKHLLPFMESQINACTSRIDAVWDCYSETSLKSQIRGKRLGIAEAKKIRVSSNIPLPKGKDWQNFLKVSKNKEELFNFLSEELINVTSESPYFLLTTKGELVLSNKEIDLTSVSPSNQEEADSRMMLHLLDAVKNGHEKIFLRTVDSDVVILCLHFLFVFQNYGLSELWVGFGTGKAYRDIPVHEVASILGHKNCEALPFFHAFTGCDMTSSMQGIGKKTGWRAWSNFPEVTDTMIELMNFPQLLEEDSMYMLRLERLTVQMYIKSSTCESVNEARKIMFTQNLRSLETIPPTKAALFQHVKRTLLVASFIWHKALEKKPIIPDPSQYGWEWNPRMSIWVPYWTALEDVSSACSMLIHCGCKKSCVKNCKCEKAGLRCTPLCKCQGGCTRNQ